MNLGNVVVLTGAGISAESGLRTFRDNDGLWEEHRVEDVATPYAWARDPGLVWRFYQERRRQLGSVVPNPAHYALVDLARSSEGFTLITQNVDDLHERAGSKGAIHMHGQLRMLRCEESGISEERMGADDLTDGFAECRCCEVGSRMRPDIVWFYEQPMHMEEIYRAIGECSVFIVVGSSGHVYPAADLVTIARRRGARTVLVNLEEPMNVGEFDEVHLGPAGDVLPGLVLDWSRHGDHK